MDRDLAKNMLAESQNEEDEIAALRAGADDYLSKPVHPELLMARLKALSRRFKQSPSRGFSDLPFNVRERTLYAGGKTQQLTPKECDLLSYLMEHEGQTLSREQILHEVWAYECAVQTRTVDTHVKQLRKKLGECAFLIKTIWKKGYRFGPTTDNEDETGSW